MAKLTLRLGERKQIAEATLSLRLELDGQSLSFQPGQFVRVGLPEPRYPDPKGHARSFSIASTPADPFLLIATRLTGSGYKRTLAELPLGAPVIVGTPTGPFVLQGAPDAPVALFAGGIGITPFRSMIKHARECGATRPLTLVYANRCPEQAAFLDEFQEWARDTAGFRLLATMTQPDKAQQPWTGPTGYVDAAFVRQHLPQEPAGGCYVAGPPRFVDGVTEALKAAGFNDQRVWTDEFTGY